MTASLLAAPLAAGFAAVVFGWFCIRLTGVYLAMLTLAFAQIVWSIAYQWDAVPGGSNGIVGIWPEAWLSGDVYYYFPLIVFVPPIVFVTLLAFSPFAYTLPPLTRLAL